MRKVIFKKWIPLLWENEDGRSTKRKDASPQVVGTSCWSDFIHEGFFHQWGNGFEELRGDSVGNYTYGIIEDEEGVINEVLPTNIKFIK